MSHPQEELDVAIIGAGPAGLGAGHEISRNAGSRRLRVRIFEQGRELTSRQCPAKRLKKCAACAICQVLSGIGGAGLFSDGKLVDLGCLSKPSEELRNGVLTKFHYIERAFGRLNVVELLACVQKIVNETGIPVEASRKDIGAITAFQQAIASRHLRFEHTEVCHIGQDRLPTFTTRVVSRLRESGIDVYSGVPINTIRRSGGKFILSCGSRSIKTKAVLVATGRGSVRWLRKMMSRLGVNFRWDHVDIGVRVETQSSHLSHFSYMSWDPKIHFTASSGRIVRTFCVCEGGLLVPYLSDGLLNVGGASPCKESRRARRSNFGVLVKIPGISYQATYGYARRYAQRLRERYGNVPVVESYASFMGSSNDAFPRTCSAPFWTAGRLQGALTGPILLDIQEFLVNLEAIAEGLASRSTAVIGPVIEWPACEYELTDHGETCVPGLFIAGDVSGRVQGIVAGFISGIAAAREIIKRTI